MATPVVTSAADATAKTGVAFTYTITGSNVPTSYAATPLPTWLSVNTGTGAITGTPPQTVSPPTITISATNASGTGTASLNIRVEVNSGVIALNDLKSAWFAAKGFASNTLQGQISAYLSANGGGKSNDLNTQWYTFLSAKGRTGSTTDMYKAELIASVAGLHSNMSLTDLENKFYSDTAHTFA